MSILFIFEIVNRVSDKIKPEMQHESEQNLTITNFSDDNKANMPDQDSTPNYFTLYLRLYSIFQKINP